MLIDKWQRKPIYTDFEDLMGWRDPDVDLTGFEREVRTSRSSWPRRECFFGSTWTTSPSAN